MSLSSRIRIDPVAFAETFRRLRVNKGLSQPALAMEMSILARGTTGDPTYATIPVEWVRSIEQARTNTVSSERVALAALALGVTVSDLLPAAETPPATATDVALVLRGYGVSDKAIGRIMAYIESQKNGDDLDDDLD